MFNPGAHGFSEVLVCFFFYKQQQRQRLCRFWHEYTFYNIALSIAMFFGRYWLAIPALAIAGSLVQKKKVPVTAGTLPTHTPLFIFWLIAVVIIVGALSFLRPCLSGLLSNI